MKPVFRRAALTILTAGLCASCLDPLVSDYVPLSAYDVFAMDEVPLLETDEALTKQTDEHDGVDRIVPRLSAFADGERVWYWPFGPAPATAIPIYIVADRTADGEFVPRDEHLPIIDSMPGDEGYSPFWEVFFLVVTDTYDGEIIASFSAVQSAQLLGVIEEPQRPWLYINCPVVHPDVRLETRDGLKEPSLAYYRNLRVPIFTFETLPVNHDGTIEVREALVLRREGGEPLDETLRGVDMTGDGDTNDGNTVFRVGLGSDDYTPLRKMVNVVVPADTESIDTNQDETDSDY
ncbi:MAG: hypothetical protein ACI9OJ_004302, partial [Myxococcota bacterium]